MAPKTETVETLHAPHGTTPQKSTRTKPGQHGIFVTVSDEFYAKLEKTADGRPINAWLSRLIARAEFKELEG